MYPSMKTRTAIEYEEAIEQSLRDATYYLHASDRRANEHNAAATLRAIGGCLFNLAEASSFLEDYENSDGR